jgi:surface antigen
MKNSKVLTLVLLASIISGCNQNGAPGGGVLNGGGINKQDIGALGGAIGGGIIGSNVGKGKGAIAGTIGGALLGGLLGSSVGKSLDNADLAAYNQASQNALETGQPGQSLPWRNEQSGNYGYITPQNYTQGANGQYCREYNQTIVVGGKKQQGFGKACRQPDGSWQVVQ